MDIKKLSKDHRNTALDLVDAMRWDHVWLYGLIDQCKQLQQHQRRHNDG